MAKQGIKIPEALFQPFLNDPKLKKQQLVSSLFLFSILATSISRSFHLDSFSTALTDVCRSVWTAISIIWQVTMISGLLATSFSIGVN